MAASLQLQCARASRWDGFSPVVVWALLTETASPVAEPDRLWDMQASLVAVLSCSTTRGIFPGQGWRRATLHRLKVSLLEVNPRLNNRQLCDLETQPPHLHRHISFYYTLQILLFFFFTNEGLWQLYVKPVYQHCFPTAFAHVMFLCHILVILAIFQTFSHYFYLWWWSVISDIWCYVVTVMGATSHTNVRAWT